MLIDSRLQVSKEQELEGTGAEDSTDFIDFGSDRDVAPGEPMWIVIVAREGLDGNTPTLDIDVEHDDESDFSGAEDLYSHPQLAEDDFATGEIVVIPLPWGCKRYLRLEYTLGAASGDPTVTIDAFLTNQDPRYLRSYPDAI